MIDIEALREVLRDDRLHIGIGAIRRLILSEDRSYLKVIVSVFPEEREIVATMTWENVGPNSGDFEFPLAGDLILFAQADGDDDNAFVIKRLTSTEDKIPESAVGGDKVHKARSGNKYWNISDTRINLSKSDTEPTENLVLGQVFKQFASDLLDILKDHAQTDSEHVHIGNLGYVTAPPQEAPDYLQRKTGYTNLQSSPINDEEVLSDLSFTEKGN